MRCFRGYTNHSHAPNNQRTNCVVLKRISDNHPQFRPSDGVKANGFRYVKKEDVAVVSDGKENDLVNSSAQRFTLKEVADATDSLIQQVTWVREDLEKCTKVTWPERIRKLLSSNWIAMDCKEAGAREFLAEVVTLSCADHPNLVKLIGYVVAEDQRLLVYEYMPLGSFDRHLFGDNTHVSTRVCQGRATDIQIRHLQLWSCSSGTDRWQKDNRSHKTS